MLEQVDAGYGEATHCRECFAGEPRVEAALIDVAQPRWVGEGYESSRPRVVFVLLNPGAGSASKEAGNRRALSVLGGYSEGRTSLREVLSFQEQHMQTWGTPPGRFLRFYTEGSGLPLRQLAFVNVALCASARNEYPKWMLERCFSAHTGRIMRALAPDVVLLSGTSTHRFAKRLRQLCPQARVEPILHYAHRKGKDAERKELVRVGEIIASTRR